VVGAQPLFLFPSLVFLLVFCVEASPFGLLVFVVIYPSTPASASISFQPAPPPAGEGR
jgi:hypothetical protein